MSSLTHFPHTHIRRKNFLCNCEWGEWVGRQTDSSFYVAVKEDISFFVVGRNAVGRLVPDAYETKNRNLYEGVEHAQIFQR